MSNSFADLHSRHHITELRIYSELTIHSDGWYTSHVSETKPATTTRTDRRLTETRGRLLGAARELFDEKGVGETRIGEITERADVAAGSFYNHFSDKNAIVKSLLAEIAEEQGARVDRLTREIEDPAVVMSYAHRHFVRLALADPVFGQLVIRLEPSHGLMRKVLGRGPSVTSRTGSALGASTPRMRPPPCMQSVAH